MGAERPLSGLGLLAVMARVCMGGTFDHLHRGHRALLARAATLPSDHVFVGVTSDELASRGRSRTVRPLAERVAAVRAFVRQWPHLEVAEIKDPVGRAMEAGFTHIVVTPETRGRALDISRERERAGLAALEVVVVPFVLADDGRPVRATRVAHGEIDAEGHLLRAPTVVVGSENPAKVAAVRAVFARFWKEPSVKTRKVASRVAEQPVGEATWKGAAERAHAAIAGAPSADFGVGIEAGLLRVTKEARWYDVQVVAIVDAGGRVTTGVGPGFEHPPAVLKEVIEGGRTVGEAVGALADDADIGRKGGAIGWLSGGALDRAALTESAVLMALLPRLRPELYGL